MTSFFCFGSNRISPFSFLCMCVVCDACFFFLLLRWLLLDRSCDSSRLPQSCETYALNMLETMPIWICCLYDWKAQSSCEFRRKNMACARWEIVLNSIYGYDSPNMPCRQYSFGHLHLVYVYYKDWQNRIRIFFFFGKRESCFLLIW